MIRAFDAIDGSTSFTGTRDPSPTTIDAQEAAIRTSAILAYQAMDASSLKGTATEGLPAALAGRLVIQRQ